MTDTSSNSGSQDQVTPLAAWLQRNGWNLGVLVAMILAAAAGLRFVGKLEERANSAHDRVSRLEYQVDQLDQKMDEGLAKISQRLNSQLAALEDAKQTAVSEIRASVLEPETPVVFQDGRLTSGYDMGVYAAGGRRDWLKVESGMMCMQYPSGLQAGAVFITVGRPTQSPRAALHYCSVQPMRRSPCRIPHTLESVPLSSR